MTEEMRYILYLPARVFVNDEVVLFLNEITSKYILKAKYHFVVIKHQYLLRDLIFISLNAIGRLH